MKESAGNERVIRILRVVADLYPSVVGGIGVHAHEMSKWQVKFGHEVTVYTSNADGKATRESEDGYEIVRFKPLVKLIGNSFMPGLFFKLRRARNDFDVIHAHSHLFLATNLCALARKLGLPPLVITNHGLMSQTAPLWLQKIYIPTVAKWTLNAADRVICYTSEEKMRLEELGIATEKIKVIHNGVNTEVFTPSKTRKAETNNRILWIGRYVPGKGVDCLVDAFNILVHKNQDFRLTMVGEGPLKAQVQDKVTNLGLGQHVSFKSFIPNTELPKLYRDSGAFVLTSINEGVPRTILEAMACGVPVVSTELPQLVKIVEGCGLLVPVEDAKAVADAVSRIAADTELARILGKNGCAKVAKHYSWENTVKETIELYEELIQWQKS